MAIRTDLNVISLCAGGGGLDLGLRLAEPRARTVCYVEREITEAAVLAKGIAAGLLDDAPIWSDLLSFDAGAWRGRVHGVVGGFPCQPHSFAGKRLGEADERNLWPAVARVVFDAAPEFCFFENVPGIAAFYWRVIRPDLQALGYEVEEGIFSAEEVGAPHLRERLFILAVRNGGGFRAHISDIRTGQPDVDRSGEGLADTDAGHGGQPNRTVEAGRAVVEAITGSEAPSGDSGELADALDGTGRTKPQQQHSQRADIAGRGGRPLEYTDSTRPKGSRCPESSRRIESAATCCGRLLVHSGCERCGAGEVPQGWKPVAFPPGPSDRDGWQRWLDAWPGTEPALRRDADGLAFRADRLRVLGNGVVPVVAAKAFRELRGRF